MKFFKFDVEGYNDGKYYFETHYFNVESIKEIIVSSSIGNKFILKTVSGAVFYIEKDRLNSLFELLDLGEKECKK